MNKKFFRVCESIHGGTSAIYHYINPNQIVSLQISYGSHEVCIEALLTNNMRVIFMNKDDVVSLIGNEEYLKLQEEMIEYAKREGWHIDKQHLSRRYYG